MKTLTREPRCSAAEAERFCGIQPTREHYDALFRESVRINKPDGSPLAVFLRSPIAPELCEAAYHTFHLMDAAPVNRGIAAIGRGAPRPVMKKGQRSNTRFIPTEMLKAAGLGDAVSGVAGYMDRYPRMPFCRKTKFSIDHAAAFESALPFVREVGDLFRRHIPDRYAAQVAAIERTEKDFVIPGTPYTTITVNRNFPTRVHQDAGDLKAGFGCMSVLRRGRYSGGFFTMPRWGVAFDCGQGDVLLADVHEWHGNTRISGLPGSYERISCVFYYRERMAQCGTAAQELERARNRRKGDPVTGRP